MTCSNSSNDLDLDLVATSESEQGFYRQLEGLAVCNLVAANDAVAVTRTLWDGRIAHRLPEPGVPDAGGWS